MNLHDISAMDMIRRTERSRRLHSMNTLIDTLRKLELVKVSASGHERIISYERWENMGKPDADYIFYISYKDDEVEKHQVFI